MLCNCCILKLSAGSPPMSLVQIRFCDDMLVNELLFFTCLAWVHLNALHLNSFHPQSSFQVTQSPCNCNITFHIRIDSITWLFPVPQAEDPSSATNTKPSTRTRARPYPTIVYNHLTISYTPKSHTKLSIISSIFLSITMNTESL